MLNISKKTSNPYFVYSPGDVAWEFDPSDKSSPDLWTLQWRFNERDGVSDCLLIRLFKAQIKENIKAGLAPVTGEFPAQRASNAEKVSIWWRHHEPHDTLLNRVSTQLCWME